MQALMIGCGNMGSSLLRRWIEIEDVDFTVVDPMADFAYGSVRLLKDQNDLGDEMFNLVIVALKPQLIDKILPDYLKHMLEGCTILSMAAGYSSERLRTLSGGRAVIRIMPNMPASLGNGTSGLFATDSVASEHLQTVLTLMNTTGEVIQVDQEEHLDRVTAVAGSGPGYVFEIARTYSEAAEELGFDAVTARRLVLSTIAGSIAMALETGEDLEDLRNSVTSKAGTTAAGLKALNGDGTLTQLFKDTTRAAYDRAIELR